MIIIVDSRKKCGACRWLLSVHFIKSVIVHAAVSSEERKKGAAEHVCAIITSKKSDMPWRAKGGDNAEFFDIG